MAGPGNSRGFQGVFTPQRYWLLLPSWLVVGFFMVAPVLIMLVYSFLT